MTFILREILLLMWIGIFFPLHIKLRSVSHISTSFQAITVLLQAFTASLCAFCCWDIGLSFWFQFEFKSYGDVFIFSWGVTEINTLYFEALTVTSSANPGLCGFVTHLIVACYLLWKRVPLPWIHLSIIITVDTYCFTQTCWSCVNSSNICRQVYIP